MIMPPLTFNLRIKNPEGRGFRLWLPLFLIWPFVLIMVLAFAPVVLLLSLILWPFGKGKKLLTIAPLILGVFCHLRGMMVAISGEEEVYVNIK